MSSWVDVIKLFLRCNLNFEGLTMSDIYTLVYYLRLRHGSTTVEQLMVPPVWVD
jgi:hypothetical protein